MEKLVGKTLVFTDQHFGIKGNSPLRQRVGVRAVKSMLDTVKRDGISNVIFCGDYFHQRSSVSVDTLNIAYKCLQALAKQCKVYMVLGNHDLFNKSTVDVNSINIFRDNASIVVVDYPIEVMLNAKKALLVPWLADLSAFKPETYDFVFGHFDISAKFLIASYAREHSRAVAASNDVAASIDCDSSLGQPIEQTSKPEELLGSFIDLAKRDGTVFAGHIHQHKEMSARGRKFIFVGTPYEQNLGDIDCKCGYYEIDELGNYAFIETEGVPKHVQFKSSAIAACGVDSFDFSQARGNIVQKVYDVDVSMEDDLKINQKIASYKPYEELLPDYQVALDLTKSESECSQGHLVKMLKKSKLDYVKGYIDTLDTKALSQDGIDKDKLFSLMKSYYSRVVGEQE